MKCEMCLRTQVFRTATLKGGLLARGRRDVFVDSCYCAAFIVFWGLLFVLTRRAHFYIYRLFNLISGQRLEGGKGSDGGGFSDLQHIM